MFGPETALAYRPTPERRGYRICLLCDDPKAWIMPWVERLLTVLSPYQTVTVCHDPDRLPEGDFCFLLGCTRLLAAGALARHRHNLVVHESDLPRGRGWSPLAWQVVAGARSIPVSLFEAVAQADAGPVYLQGVIELDGSELLPELRAKQGHVTVALVLAFLERWPDLPARPQEGEPSYYRRRTRQDDRLDTDKSLAELFNRLRVADNERHPAWFELEGRRFRLAIHPMENGIGGPEEV